MAEQNPQEVTPQVPLGDGVSEPMSFSGTDLALGIGGAVLGGIIGAVL
jgi:hypothetical protein